MLPRLLIILLLAAGLGFGGYYAYNNYYLTPERILTNSADKFAKLKTVHADLDIASVSRVPNSQGLDQTVQSNINGFSDANVTDKTQSMHLTLGTGSTSLGMDIILLQGGQYYMKTAVFGPNWVLVTNDDLKQAGEISVDPQSNDYVTQSIGLLKSINKNSVTKLNDDTVNGLKSTHLRVDISTTQYIDFLNQLKASQSMIDLFKSSTISTEVWIDKSNGYIIKMASTIKNATSPGNISTDLTMTITYSKYNQPVSIAKPEGTITSYQDVLKQLQQNPPTSSSSNSVSAAPAAPAKPSCQEYNIREGQFASDKCYTSKDYSDLDYYLNAYNNAAISANGAVSSMKITCDGSDFFKDSCAQDQATKSQADQNIAKYTTTIQGIIARGT